MIEVPGGIGELVGNRLLEDVLLNSRRVFEWMYASFMMNAT